MCCKLVGVEELSKRPGAWCSLVQIGKGCGDYENRPGGCREFDCLWLMSEMAESLRPDRCKAVFAGAKYGTRSVIYLDPATPNHWQTNREVHTLISLIREKFDVIIVAGENRMFLPSPETLEQVKKMRQSGTLVGTDQQIAWAMEIREVLMTVQEECASEATDGQICKAGMLLRSQTSAQWFIDHRGGIAGPGLTSENKIAAKNALLHIAAE